MPNKQTLLIDADGRITFAYADELAGLLDEGRVSIRRGSHVEPSPAGGWLVDLSPIAGPPALGVYRLRQDALDAERDWIDRHIGEIGARTWNAESFTSDTKT